jgi:hypothetical protein
MVEETCGRVVPVANRSEGQCIAGLAAEIVALAGNEDLRLALSHGAIALIGSAPGRSWWPLSAPKSKIDCSAIKREQRNARQATWFGHKTLSGS